MAGRYKTCNQPILRNQESLLPEIYDELRSIAARLMVDENSGHTLQATALVNEAWVRLQHRPTMTVNDRSHLIALVSSQMRRALIDHARRRNASKRPSHGIRISLDSQSQVATDATGSDTPDLIDLDLIDLCKALDELHVCNKRHCQVFELRFFGGLSVDDCARYLNVSARTIKSDWKFSGAWLANRLQLTRLHG